MGKRKEISSTDFREGNWGKERGESPDKRVLSFFLIMFPSLIIIAMALLVNSKETWWIMVALIIYQSIMLKQFLDNYYGPYGTFS